MYRGGGLFSRDFIWCSQVEGVRNLVAPGMFQMKLAANVVDCTLPHCPLSLKKGKIEVVGIF